MLIFNTPPSLTNAAKKQEMQKIFGRFLILTLWCLFPLFIMAQPQEDSTTLVRVEMNDGNEFIGHIVTQDTYNLTLKTDKLGELTFNKKDVVKITPINRDNIKKGEYWFENPQSARYLWSPDGYGLKKGEGYYQNIWVLFNQVSYGVTNYFTIGAGVLPVFLFGGGATPVWITPKFSIPVVKDKFNVGAGALVGTVLGESGTGFGLLYGLTTAGSRDMNISLGIGYGVSGSGWAKSPLISLSALARTGARGYLLTENYYLGMDGETLVILSAGYRWVIKKAGLDFGLVMPIAEDLNFFALPWLGVTIPFGDH
jgi:hypothetical protein